MNSGIESKHSCHSVAEWTAHATLHFWAKGCARDLVRSQVALLTVCIEVQTPEPRGLESCTRNRAETAWGDS